MPAISFAGARKHTERVPFVAERGYPLAMTDQQQRTRLIAEDEDGNEYEYFETYVPFDGDTYHEWIVEELPEQRYRLWRIDGFPESGIVSYRRREECSAAELQSAGYAEEPRVKRPVQR